MRPSRQVVASGSTLVFPVDYFQSNLSIEAVPSGGSTYTVSFTADDPNEVTPVWFVVSAAMTGATTNQFAAISNQPVRALQIAVTVAGSVAFTVLQGSGAGGIAVGRMNS